MLCQVRRNVTGSWASAFQKLLIQSVLRVAMMSSYTARTSGLAALYSINPRVAMETRLAVWAFVGGECQILALQADDPANVRHQDARPGGYVIQECMACPSG